MRVHSLSFVLLILLLTACSEDDFFNESSIASQDINLDQAASVQGNNDRDRRPGNSRETEIIDDWLSLFLSLDQYATGMRPNGIARAIAYINLAAYEVYAQSSQQLSSTQNQLSGLQIEDIPEQRFDRAVALNACYAMVMDHFLLHLPGNMRNQIGQLEEELNDQFANDNSDNTTLAIEWGTTVANAVIAYSETDINAETQILDPQPTSYVPPTGEGYWTFSAEPERALFPYWSNVRTFTIGPDETSTVAPEEYSEEPSTPYYQQMYAVYEANNSARENQDENLWIAEFWSDDVENLMMSPPGRQVSIARQLIDLEDMRVEQALYLLLKLGFAMNDAAVSAWDDKYQYMVMRPSVYISNYIDPNYQTNLFRLIPWPNPTFPAYPSGHAVFASAAAGVFIDFFGDSYNFTDRTHEGRTEFQGSPRSFSSFDEMARENAFSRIPLGVHMEMDCTEGLRLGYEISDAVNNIDLMDNRRPNP